MGNNGKMKINVKFLASIREIAGGAHEMQFELNSGYTVKDLLEFLELRFGAEFKEAAGKPFEDENPRLRSLLTEEILIISGDPEQN